MTRQELRVQIHCIVVFSLTAPA